MSDINRVILTGHTTSDIVLSKTATGKTVANFTLAVSCKKDETIFVRCQLWGVVAENCAKFVGKGSKIGLDGHLNVRQYDKDGQKRILVEVVGENISWENIKKPGQNDSDSSTEGLENPAFEEILDNEGELMPF